MTKPSKARTRSTRQPRKPAPRHTQPRRSPEANAAVADYHAAVHRRRVRVMIDICDVALDTYEDAVLTQVERARQILSDVERWTGGEPEPECMRTWRAACAKIFAAGTVDNYTAEQHALKRQLDALLPDDIELTERVATLALDQACGTGRSLDLCIDSLRESVCDTVGYESFAERVLEAIDAATGEPQGSAATLRLLSSEALS